jgi:signal peptidase II
MKCFCPRPRLIFWILSVLLLISDQWTKSRVQEQFRVGQSREIIPGFFNLTYVLNDGMAFGLFQGRNVLLGLMVAGIMAGMFWWSRHLDWRKSEMNILAAMIFSGAVGNLIDRIRSGHVIDFLHVYWRDYHWPVFNVADSCISLSMVWIFWQMWVMDRKHLSGPEKGSDLTGTS